MGAEQEAVVHEFIGAFRDSWPDSFDGPLSLLADDATYQVIVPLTEPIQGRDAIKAEWEQMMERVSQQRHDMKAVASNDTTVFTERVDYSEMNGHWASIPLVAVFELNSDGKIAAWREYLDASNVAAQHGMTLDELRASVEQ
jgi:limonene-1,2-epoxide hydrolase